MLGPEIPRRKTRRLAAINAQRKNMILSAMNNNSPPPLHRRKRVLEDSNQNQKITNFFPTRKSSRKTGKQLEEEENRHLRDAIYSCCNEKLLDVYSCPIKGRGIRAGTSFKKNEFVVEYRGDMIDYQEAKEREKEYALNPMLGSYMYFFEYKNKKWCIDATGESKYKGRLINHSYLKPNLRTKVVEVGGRHHLILVAKRDIMEGEELLYDYGDRDPQNIAHSPWLVES
ncbi:unnamed protein product, partial [Mesorhabditis spiculigera]